MGLKAGKHDSLTLKITGIGKKKSSIKIRPSPGSEKTRPLQEGEALTATGDKVELKLWDNWVGKFEVGQTCRYNFPSKRSILIFLSRSISSLWHHPGSIAGAAWPAGVTDGGADMDSPRS